MLTVRAHDENHSSRKLIYWLSGLTVLFAAILVVVVYSYPRQQLLAFNAEYIGTYRGLGWHDEPGYFGKNWFRIHWKADDGILTEVIYREYGYSPVRSSYPDGSLRYAGLCLVEQNGTLDEPIPDEHDVLQAKYYSPEGRLLSEIKGATGIQTLCDAAGNVVWELKLVGGQRRALTVRDSSGEVLRSIYYDQTGDAIEPFAYVKNHANDTPRIRGRGLVKGFHEDPGGEIGRWYWFYDDGSLESIVNHVLEPPVEQMFERGERFPTEEERAEIRAIEAKLECQSTAELSNTLDGD